MWTGPSLKCDDTSMQKKEASETSKADGERAPSKAEDAGAAAPFITATAAKAKKSRKRPKQNVEHVVEEDDKFLDDAMAKASAERQRHEIDAHRAKPYPK